MLKEFKQFAMRGNVVDLAVGVIIGGTFGKIVSSLVNDVVMPPISRLTGGIDFSDLVVADIRYGAFLQNVLDFLIIAFAVFFMVKAVNRLQRKKEEEAPSTGSGQEKPGELSTQEKLLTEIRDLLKNSGTPSDL